MYFMKQDLCTIIEDNLKFIQQYPVDELILKLKLVALNVVLRLKRIQ